MANDFREKNVRFYYVYKQLAHPGWNGYESPLNLEERLLHIAEAKRRLKTEIPWLCDTMQNDFARSLGFAPNSEFIFDPLGRIVHRDGWNTPAELRVALEALVGKPEYNTPASQASIEALTYWSRKPNKSASATNEKSNKPEDVVMLQSVPGLSREQPHYAKLRAEADEDLLFFGSGKLYVTVALDPIYQVHWNNLSEPVRIRLQHASGVQVEPPELAASLPDQPTDEADREFVLQVENWDGTSILGVELNYIVCQDEQGWCKPIQQSYSLASETRRDGGMRIRREHEQRMLDYLRYRDEPLPEADITAGREQLQSLVGTWEMQTEEVYGESRLWELKFDWVDDALVAQSDYDASAPKVPVLAFDGQKLKILQRAGPFPEAIELRLDKDTLKGTHLSVFGDLKVKGKRQ